MQLRDATVPVVQARRRCEGIGYPAALFARLSRMHDLFRFHSIFAHFAYFAATVLWGITSSLPVEFNSDASDRLIRRSTPGPSFLASSTNTSSEKMATWRHSIAMSTPHPWSFPGSCVFRASRAQYVLTKP